MRYCWAEFMVELALDAVAAVPIMKGFGAPAELVFYRGLI